LRTKRAARFPEPPYPLPRNNKTERQHDESATREAILQFRGRLKNVPEMAGEIKSEDRNPKSE